MRDDSLELLRRQRLHFREAEQQVVAIPAERPKEGGLGRGVAVLGQQHAVQAWRAKFAHEPVDQREELRCIGAPNANPVGVLEGDSERAEDHEEEQYEGRREGQDAIGRSVEPQRPHQQRDRSSQPDKNKPHVGVAGEGEQRHPPRVALTVPFRMGLALSNKRLEVLRCHCHAHDATHPSPRNCASRSPEWRLLRPAVPIAAGGAACHVVVVAAIGYRPRRCLNGGRRSSKARWWRGHALTPLLHDPHPSLPPYTKLSPPRCLTLVGTEGMVVFSVGSIGVGMLGLLLSRRGAASLAQTRRRSARAFNPSAAPASLTHALAF